MAEKVEEKPKVPRMDLTEFHTDGYIQEVNRIFFHRLGLALAAEYDEETGKVTSLSVVDWRSDPEGMFFANGQLSPSKAEYVEAQRALHLPPRQDALLADMRRLGLLGPGAICEAVAGVQPIGFEWNREELDEWDKDA